MPNCLTSEGLVVVDEPSADMAAVALGAFSDDLAVLDPVVSSSLRTAMGFDAALGQTTVVPGEDDHLVVIVGLGERADLDVAGVRRAAAAATHAARTVDSLSLLVPGQAAEAGIAVADATTAAADGALAASYRFTELKGRPADDWGLVGIELVAPGVVAADALLGAVGHLAAGVALARDLVNRPGGSLSAAELGEVAEAVAADVGLDVEVWDRSRCESERLGGLLGVNRGSADEPRLIHLTWHPADEAPGSIALVGKGITFDSGGLSLKSGDGMKQMKTDMAGAAAVLGAMAALPAVDPPIRVDAWIAATDNMPSGTAMKVGDVLTARNGTTVEVLNTDAEGRLVLADALSLAAELRPGAIVDLATLTGACMTALGNKIAGLMGNDQTLVDGVRAAADAAGEEVWQLPLPAAYRPELDSRIADLRNIGDGPRAGALKAGLFLAEFVDGLPWAHLDVAGPVFTDETTPGAGPGATGFGVRLLLELLRGD